MRRGALVTVVIVLLLATMIPSALAESCTTAGMAVGWGVCYQDREHVLEPVAWGVGGGVAGVSGGPVSAAVSAAGGIIGDTLHQIIYGTARPTFCVLWYCF